MCSQRILSRLRFVANNRGALKQPLKQILQNTISSIRYLCQKESNKHFILSTTFVERAKQVIKLSDAWAKHQTTGRLEKLVEAIHYLKRTGNIQTLLDTIPNRDMDPSSRQTLYNMVSKV